MEVPVRSENRLPADTPNGGTRYGPENAPGTGAGRPPGARAAVRVPGRHATFGVHEADDPAALRDAVRSLPPAPWLGVSAEPLATHPQERT